MMYHLDGRRHRQTLVYFGEPQDVVTYRVITKTPSPRPPFPTPSRGPHMFIAEAFFSATSVPWTASERTLDILGCIVSGAPGAPP